MRFKEFTDLCKIRDSEINVLFMSYAAMRSKPDTCTRTFCLYQSFKCLVYSLSRGDLKSMHMGFGRSPVHQASGTVNQNH